VAKAHFKAGWVHADWFAFVAGAMYYMFFKFSRLPSWLVVRSQRSAAAEGDNFFFFF
jgi:hypothetical protein